MRRPLLCPDFSLINFIPSNKGALDNWLIDAAGNIAVSVSDLGLLSRIHALIVPIFASTEQAVEWGSHLTVEQHAILLDMQRSASNAAYGEPNLQCMVNLATQSQLMREAAEAAPSR